MNTKQKYEFADWMVHTVVPERLELLNGEMRDGSRTCTVIAASIAKLRALPTINNAKAWTDARPAVEQNYYDLSSLSALSALSDLSDLSNLSDLSALRALSALSALSALRDLRDLSALLEALYRRHITEAIDRGFVSVPVIPQIDAAILAAIEAPGADGFDMGDWHKTNCKTTHCRGGWAVVLAGKAGLALEKEFLTPTAASLIYIASRPDKPIPDFYTDTETALADIRKCAAEQTSAAIG